MAKKEIFSRNSITIAAFIIIVIGGGIAALAYVGVSNRTVYIDKSLITAPIVQLSASAPGILRETYVQEGDTIPPNTVVAEVGTELIKSTSGGLVVTVNDNIGKLVSPQDAVVETIDPTQLRVVGQIDENKGLDRIKVGDPVTFTVDAFGGQQFDGIVDEVSPTSNQSGIVFNISSDRPTQQFDVKVRYDSAAYPQFKNGMSARMTIFVQ